MDAALYAKKVAAKAARAEAKAEAKEVKAAAKAAKKAAKKSAKAKKHLPKGRVNDFEAEKFLEVDAADDDPSVVKETTLSKIDCATLEKLHRKALSQSLSERGTSAAERHSATCASFVQGINARVALGLNMPASIEGILTALFNMIDVNSRQFMSEKDFTRIKMLGGETCVRVVDNAKDSKGRVYLSGWLKQWDKEQDWDSLNAGELRAVRETIAKLKKDCSPKTVADIRNVLLELFAALDTGGDGSVSKVEFSLARQYFPTSGAMRFPSSGDIAVHFDKDGDEEVDQREWIAGFAALGQWDRLSPDEVDTLYCKLKTTLDHVIVGFKEAEDARRLLDGEPEETQSCAGSGCALS